MLKVSVIIPLHNNAHILKSLIEAFECQTVSMENFELIIVNDSSDDDPGKVIKEYLDKDYIVFLENKERKGAAFSRNVGIDVAKGKIIIFSDSDAVPCGEFIEEHLNFHNLYKEPQYAVLGQMRYPKDIQITPLMRLGNVVGTWEDMANDSRIFYDWEYFRTTNVSVKREFLKTRFDERIDVLEDVELGYRLSKEGMIVVFNRKAISYHYHFITPQEYIDKTLRYGRSFGMLVYLYGEAARKAMAGHAGLFPDESRPFGVKNLKELLRRVTMNDLFACVIKQLARMCENLNERVSLVLYNKLYKYLLLKGYTRAKKEKKKYVR